VVEIETEKANMEVPAPSAGVLGHLVAEIGAVVPVGGVLAVLEGPESPRRTGPCVGRDSRARHCRTG
jgi:pyruvate/2-oxoglutarate dehydrogenase complex dihydrolipoamide acyltransferase (E2) component